MKRKRLPQSYVTIENIDRKQCKFYGGSSMQHLDDNGGTCMDPEVIIIKNDYGRQLYNALIRSFDYRETGAKPLCEDITYPYYMVNCDWFTVGCHFGMWYGFDDFERLSKDVAVDTFVDDFENFKWTLISSVTYPDKNRRYAKSTIE